MSFTKRLVRVAALPALVAVVLAPLSAQPAKKQQPSDQGITREQADAILDELRQIRQLLERQGTANAPQAKEDAPVKAKLGIPESAQMLGSKAAPVTIVEFTDYQCPFCQRFHVSTFPNLKKEYIDTGKVRFVSRDMPLDFHPNALRAAQAARCAADQKQFWPMRDLMAGSPDKLDLTSLVAFATSLKMDSGAFRTCVESEKYKAAVQADVLEAMRIGAEGTPAFIIGKSTIDGVDGELVVGAQPYPIFEQKLKQFGAQ